MDVLFGKERADKLRATLPGLSPADRENAIVEELAQSLKFLGGSFVLPFTFNDENANRTKQDLIFVTRNFKGYEIMKEIMAKESSEHVQGVPSFECLGTLSDAFRTNSTTDDLADMLLNAFSGETVTMNDIYSRHIAGKPYIIIVRITNKHLSLLKHKEN